MTIALVMIVRDDTEALARCLPTVRDLIDTWTIVDTGSKRSPRTLIRQELRAIKGTVHKRDWHSFGENRTQALELARDTADWLLVLDADMTVVVHPGLRDWLAEDPDPDVAAWRLEILEAGLVYELPLLVRGGLEWRYVGATHEYLDPAGRPQRTLHGLTINHHVDGSSRVDKHERDLDLLAPGVAAGDPRAVFYTARALDCLGRTDEAILAYQQRAHMNGWDEERWYARFSAAKLAGDVPGLIAAHMERPWRHEPLTAAARLVASQANEDVLFKELVP